MYNEEILSHMNFVRGSSRGDLGGQSREGILFTIYHKRMEDGAHSLLLKVGAHKGRTRGVVERSYSSSPT